MENKIKVSVRNLVEFIFRSGDLKSEFISNNRALEGGKIHRKIQKSQNEDYKAEVFIKHVVNYKGIIINIEGRADGVIKKDNEVIIDEIKSSTKDVSEIHEYYNPVHWAQAKCYAYMYAKENSIEHIGVRLTYCNIYDEQIEYMNEYYSIYELEEFFYSVLEKYLVWVNLNKEWIELRNKSIKQISFPFKDYRAGQREMAVHIYNTIRSEKNIFIQAPTGIGKTISTLFPSIKAIGQGLITKIFYLTAKTAAIAPPKDVFNKLKEMGLKFKVIVITAKEKVCLNDKLCCDSENCKFAKGHFDRVNEAMLELLKNEDLITRNIIEDYAKKYRICPFELSLDLTNWVDCIICDYNYVFDPRVYLKGFFENGKQDFVFLVDEAHNLVDRGREMFSAVINKQNFLECKKLVGKNNKKLYKILDKLNNFLLKLGKNCSDDNVYVQKEEPLEIYNSINIFIKEAEKWLSENEGIDVYDEILDAYFQASSFLKIAEFYDENYICYVEKQGKDVKLKIFCIDPSKLLRKKIGNGKSTVFFSATLMPMNYFKHILGGDSKDYNVRFPSPFPSENRKTIVVDKISTRYRDRDRSIKQISTYIKAFTEGKVGNYMVFFPSYSYMNNVVETFMCDYKNINVKVQNPSMSEEDKEKFLSNFNENSNKTFIGFCVMGGMFAEGIDLKGEKLLGAIVIGVGIPKVCIERNIIQDYFNKKNGNGYKFSYMYPGMNKVLQAMGRVIRTKEDRGIVMLIDDRFMTREYKILFQDEGKNNVIVNNEYDIMQQTMQFWNCK